MKTDKQLMNLKNIEHLIYFIRGQKVMLDRDLADLYEVETAQLKRAVRRNMDRFPEDFMFQLTKTELDNWRCRFGISNADKMGLRYSPMAFTEHGVAMLSSVLRSKKAVQVNIQIMRVFSRIRQMLIDNKQLRDEFEEMKRQTDARFRIVFEALDQLLLVDDNHKRKIGFEVKEPKAKYRKKGQ